LITVWVTSENQLAKFAVRGSSVLTQGFRGPQAGMDFRLAGPAQFLCIRQLTTNLGYDEWPNFLGNRAMVEALLSRLRHYCHTVLIDGPSLREPQG
jgi:IstB-like ATP binding protein